MPNITSGKALSHAIGLSNLHVAKLTADNAQGATYETSVHMPEIMSINIEPQNQEASLYADNGAVDAVNTISEYKLSIEMAGLPLEYKAYLLGHAFENGKMIVSNEDVAPFVGLAFESLKSNGTKRYSKFLKVKFSEPKENPKTKGDKVEFQTSTIEAKAIFRNYDGQVYQCADAEEGFNDAANWFAFNEVTEP